jgi:hypothetical protein
MRQTQQISPGTALLIGLLFIASGVFPMLSAFDMGPLVVFLLVASALVAIEARLLTGTWPRNGKFFAQQRARGLPGRIGAKLPPVAGHDPD